MEISFVAPHRSDKGSSHYVSNPAEENRIKRRSLDLLLLLYLYVETGSKETRIRPRVKQIFSLWDYDSVYPARGCRRLDPS